MDRPAALNDKSGCARVIYSSSSSWRNHSTKPSSWNGLPLENQLGMVDKSCCISVSNVTLLRHEIGERRDRSR